MTLRCSNTILRAAVGLRFGPSIGAKASIYRSRSAGRVRGQTPGVQPLRYASYTTTGLPKRRHRELESKESSGDSTASHPKSGPPNPRTKTKAELPVARSEATVSQLEDELLYVISHQQGTTTLTRILHELIDVRRVKPTQLHYTALLLCQQGSEHGSSKQIGDLLQDMEANSVQMTEGLAAAALQALVLHPDLAILLDVLQRCEEKWIKPTLQMQHFIAATYMRLSQFELAMHWLEKLESKQTQESSVFDKNQAELWLYVVFLAEIIQHTSNEELFMTICYRLHDSPSVPMREMDMPFPLWSLAFTWAVQNQCFHAVKWIWRTFVVRLYIKPDIELLSQVEGLAHRNNDQELVDSCKALTKFLTEGSRPSMDVKRAVMSDGNHPLMASQHHSTLRYARVPRNQRLDPWAMLTEDMDPGAARPRIDHLKSQQEERNAADRVNYAKSQASAPRTTFRGLIFQDVDIKELYAPFEGFDKPSKSPVDYADELVTILRHRHRTSEDEKLTQDLLKVLFNQDPGDSSRTATTIPNTPRAKTATSGTSVAMNGSKHEAAPDRESGAEQIKSGSSASSARRAARRSRSTQTRAEGNALRKHRS